MVGIPTPDVSLRRRVAQLEASQRNLQRDLERLLRAPAERNNSREVFVAQTAEDSSYPTAPANVFGLIFQTISFTRSEGNQTPTYTAHSSSVQDYGLSLVGYIAEGTYVFVKRQRNGQYVIIGQATEAGRLWLFTLNEDMGATTAGEAAADLIDLDESDTGTDVTVTDPWDIFTNLVSGAEGLCIQQVDTGGTEYYVVIQAACPT